VGGGGGDGPPGEGGDPPVRGGVPPVGGGPPGGGGGPPGGGGGSPGGNDPAEHQALPDIPFVHMLRRLGVSQVALRFIVIDENVSGLEELITLTKESIDHLFTRMDTRNIPYSTVLSNRFRLLHHHLRRLTFSGLDIQMEEITIPLIQSEALEVQAEPSKTAKSKIPLPDKFIDDK